MAGIQESVPTPCQTLLTELPFYEVADWLPGTRLPCHNSPLLPSAGAQSCGPAGRPGVALRPGGGPGEPAGCELVRVLPDCVAESAGPGLGLEAGRRLARRHRRTTVAGTTAGSPSQSHSAGPRLGGRES